MSGAEAEALAAALTDAPPDVRPASRAEGLGYRGLIVRRGGETWRIGGGAVLEAAFLRTMPADLRARYGAALPR